MNGLRHFAFRCRAAWAVFRGLAASDYTRWMRQIAGAEPGRRTAA